MRSRIFLTVLFTVLFVFLSGCGTSSSCPICGTDQYGAYANVDQIAVPEHNPTGEPGGPFNSFDISSVAPNPAVAGNYLDYISDRIGLDMVVIDTEQDLAVNAIQGANSVAGAGDGASACFQVTVPSTTPGGTPTTADVIPPDIDVYGNFTRFACRSDMSTATLGAPLPPTTIPGPTFHLNTGFGANHLWGGFPGAQCCASRANGVNPMSGPDGNTTTPDGHFLFVGNGSSNVVVFDLTTMNLAMNPPTPPTVVASIPTGVSADYDGVLGIGPCIESWNGEAGSSADCGDDRADEQWYDPTHQVLAIINGDPGLPFITFIDMSHIVSKTGTLAQQHCLPLDWPLAYGPYPAGYSSTTATYPYPLVVGGPFPYPLQGTGTGIPGTGGSGGGTPLPSPVLDPSVGGSFNPPSCIIGQIYYDGAGGTDSSSSSPGIFGLNPNTPVDTVVPAGTPPSSLDTTPGTFPCPDPSNPHVFSGVSGGAPDAPTGYPAFGVTPTGGTYTIPCHHAPILDYTNGQFTKANQVTPCATCAGAIAPAGLGGMAYDPGSDKWLLTNENSIATTNIGNVDVIDLQLGTANGPVVVGSIVTPNCMPTGITQGPGEYFLVGCADHDGETFPPNEYIINLAGGFNATSGSYDVNCTSTPLVNCVNITQVGGVDETWYNPGDNRYYLAARDMPTGGMLGVIDAGTNEWLVNVATGSNAHSVSVDPSNNHVFVPLQAGAGCKTLSANGCVGVYAQQ
ncbi:MAG: hypothetical protein WAK21_03515 [Candidatus Sulfotelmatobacter sp.]